MQSNSITKKRSLFGITYTLYRVILLPKSERFLAIELLCATKTKSRQNRVFTRSRRLIGVRSWDFYTMLMKPSPFAHPGQKNGTRSKNNIMWTFSNSKTKFVILTILMKLMKWWSWWSDEMWWSDEVMKWWSSEVMKWWTVRNSKKFALYYFSNEYQNFDYIS